MFKKDGYLLRPPVQEDAEAYYENFNPLDKEVARLTGSKPHFSREEVVGFFLKCLHDPTRRDFLITAPSGEIIGESVINEIDWESQSANFRIAIFRPEYLNRGIGTWAVEATRDYAFRELKLNRLTLDVFAFNPRAKHVYEKAGFRTVEVYEDEITMAISQEEWQKLRCTNV